jgi:hypothetical protein
VDEEGALQRILLAGEAEEVPGVHDEAVRILEFTDLEFARPPGESPERVSVSAAGGELALNVGRALDQQVHRRALPREERSGQDAEQQDQ